jgi:hypothetical protein
MATILMGTTQLRMKLRMMPIRPRRLKLTTSTPFTDTILAGTQATTTPTMVTILMDTTQLIMKLLLPRLTATRLRRLRPMSSTLSTDTILAGTQAGITPVMDTTHTATTKPRTVRQLPSLTRTRPRRLKLTTSTAFTDTILAGTDLGITLTMDNILTDGTRLRTRMRAQTTTPMATWDTTLTVLSPPPENTLKALTTPTVLPISSHQFTKTTVDKRLRDSSLMFSTQLSPSFLRNTGK